MHKTTSGLLHSNMMLIIHVVVRFDKNLRNGNLQKGESCLVRSLLAILVIKIFIAEQILSL